MIDRVKRLVARLSAWSLRHRSTRVSRRAVTGFVQHEALQYAGTMAYFSVLSIFQLLVLGVVVFSLFLGEGQARDFIVEQVQAASPLDPEVITGVIDAVIASRGGITIISFVFLVWGALGAFSALSNGINRAFENAPQRPFLRDKLLGLLLIGVTGSLVVLSVIIGVVTGVLQRAAHDALAEIPGGTLLVGAIGLVVPILLIFVAFWILYRVVPNRRVSFGEVWPGALVGTLLWTALRIGFTYYATNVANYDSAFGPISTGVTLLVFLYFASVIVLLGAEFARASVVDDELARAGGTDARRLPVLVEHVPATPPPPQRRALPRWALLAGAAVAGLLAGRLTKRDE